MIVRFLLRLGAVACLAVFVAALYQHSQRALVGSVAAAIALGIVSIWSHARAQAAERRKELRALAEAYLEPGETVQAAFEAMSGPGPYLMMIAIVFIIPLSMLLAGGDGSTLMRLWEKYTTQWSIVATDRAILVFERIHETRADILQARLPRHIRFGPVSGWWAMIRVNGTDMFVRGRFHPEVALADRLIGASYIDETWDRRGP